LGFDRCCCKDHGVWSQVKKAMIAEGKIAAPHESAREADS
jgi:hypothetical protein